MKQVAIILISLAFGFSFGFCGKSSEPAAEPTMSTNPLIVDVLAEPSVDDPPSENPYEFSENVMEILHVTDTDTLLYRNNVIHFREDAVYIVSEGDTICTFNVMDDVMYKHGNVYELHDRNGPLEISRTDANTDNYILFLYGIANEVQ